MTNLLATVILVSITGSFHCTSMCGGLIAFGTAGTTSSLGTRIGAIAAYNGARGLGYVTLATFAGALGSALDGMFVRIGFGRIAGAVAGLLMIGWGLVRLLEALGRLRLTARTTLIHVPISNLVRKLRDKPAAVRASVVGGCTAALPCGFLHAALVVAGGTGSAARGALVGAAFWLGTVPAVAGLGLGVDLLTRGIRRHATLVGAGALVVLGFSSLLGRWSPGSLFTMRAPHAEHMIHAR